jgi:hypothetical protein
MKSLSGISPSYPRAVGAPGVLRGRFAAGLAAVVFFYCCDLYAETPLSQEIKWDRIPRSTLPDKMAIALTNLYGQIVGKHCAVVFDDSRSSAKSDGFTRPLGGGLTEPSWNFKKFATDLFLRVLKQCKIDFVDGRSSKESLDEGNRQRRSEILHRFVEANHADVVLTVSIGTDTIKLETSSPAGKKLGASACRYDRHDTSYYANTPPTNRRLLEFAEANLNKKVGRGECWDLCAEAMKHENAPFAGPRDFGRVLDEDEIPFPGDLAMQGGPHFMMIRCADQDGSLTALHQNWMMGDEKGKKVVPVQIERAILTIWRPNSSPRDDTFNQVLSIWGDAAVRALSVPVAPAAPVEKKVTGNRQPVTDHRLLITDHQ